MKILVLGAGGMAGHVVATYLANKRHDVHTLSAKNKLNDSTTLLDVTNQAKLELFLVNNTFDIVINCVGLLVKQSDERKDLASYLNGFLPHYLENFYKDMSTKIIHLSTDCVFSGRNAPYYENSPYDGELFYDRSKALGEIVNSKDLTFRMSIIGPDIHPNGIGLFNWFYAQKGQINGYTDAIWNGITTIELAKGINAAIAQNLVGLYHLVPNVNISKYDLLKLFKQTFNKNDLIINPDPTVSFDKTLVNTRNDFDFDVSTYEDMIEEMQEWINNHKTLYGHYK
ncbi:MAG TPA: sugar nucleotide-binding protein [Candidatus Saccharibacteria bacterium]|nr:sugar nucleotide-binding protein [Candidatus Saccharibacteria bacterium]HRQ07117.1 sugar nucleotide-binding protein [Candidatus Saccharibacteria bacterium]